MRDEGAICKTCGGTGGHHKPSQLDPHGVGAEGHRMLSDPLTPVSDMKPSDQDAGTKDTLSRPGGGSQDSIDSLDAILEWYHIVKVGEEGTTETSWYELKQEIEAWHNTQLKAAFKRFFDTFEKEIDLQEFAIDEAEWMSLIQAMRLAENAAIDDMQANLEKQ